MNNDIYAALAYIGIPSAVTTLCFGLLEKRMDKRDKAQEARESSRERNEVLLVKSGASIALAIKNGKCNGEPEAALEYAQQMKHKPYKINCQNDCSTIPVEGCISKRWVQEFRLVFADKMA